ncbi:MAG TPA: LytR C-terminal domain-containing protein [Caulobacteraceae bacterium]|jgi:hypothetical protein|nr:LytR C-terminal domain-containing protein [Caulobacteraceae bacterium]
MTRHRILRSLLISSAALAATGCAAIQHHFAWLHLAPKPAPQLATRPLQQSPDLVKAAVDDSLYGDAVKAIDRRDYGNALELLQAARERTPQDVRVINAFGVVYDKLGRFDLSGRYYAQATRLDPGSTIVANNEAYSRVLQTRAAGSNRFTAPEVQLARATPTPTPAAKPVVRPVPTPTVTVAFAAPKAPAIRPVPLQVSPVYAATLQTVSYQFGALSGPRLPASLTEPTPQAVVQPIAEPVARPAPEIFDIATAGTASLQSVSFNEAAIERAPAPEMALDAIVAAPEAPPPPMTPAIVNTLQTADALAPQAGRVVPDGPGRVRLIPAPRQATATLAYAPKSVMTLGDPATRVSGPAILATTGRIVEVAPGVLRLEGAAHPTMIALARAPGMTGYPLAVIDASGRTDGAKATIVRLASLGWTAKIAPPTPSRQHSTIYYENGDLEVAQGLAHTLAIPVQLAACESACRGVTLVVGADALDQRSGQG